MSKLVRATILGGRRPDLLAVRAVVFAAMLAGLVPAAARAQDPATRSDLAHGDLSVDDAVRLALVHNLDLLQSQENIRAAHGSKNIAMQNYLPSLSANFGYTRRLDNSISFGGVQIPITDKNNYSTNLQLSQNLLDWSSIKSIQAANRQLEATELGHEFNRSDLVLETKRQYYLLLGAQFLASVSDSALALSQRELSRTQSLFELGMVAKSDVLKAQVRVSQSQLDVIRDRGGVVDQRSNLARIIGQPPSDDLRAADKLLEPEVAVDSTAIINDALKNRADLLASEQDWKAAEARVGAAKAGFYPRLGGAVAYNKNANELQPFTDFSRSAALSLSVPILDGAIATKGSIQQARAAAEQARYAYDKKKLDIEVEVRSTINNARQANEGVTVAKEGLNSAEEDLKLSQEKYNVGSGTILELLDAQVNLQRSRQQYVVALTGARIAEAQIERARGVRP